MDGNIKEAQKGDPSIEGIKKKMDLEKAPEFIIDEQGIMWYIDRLCVPNQANLKTQIMEEAHNVPYSIHPGGTKMFKDLQAKY